MTCTNWNDPESSSSLESSSLEFNMEDETPGSHCPVCLTNELDLEGCMNAISRKDNVTEICGECGYAEALEELHDFLEFVGWHE